MSSKELRMSKVDHHNAAGANQTSIIIELSDEFAGMPCRNYTAGSEEAPPRAPPKEPEPEVFEACTEPGRSGALIFPHFSNPCVHRPGPAMLISLFFPLQAIILADRAYRQGHSEHGCGGKIERM